MNAGAKPLGVGKRGGGGLGKRKGRGGLDVGKKVCRVGTGGNLTFAGGDLGRSDTFDGPGGKPSEGGCDVWNES